MTTRMQASAFPLLAAALFGFAPIAAWSQGRAQTPPATVAPAAPQTPAQTPAAQAGRGRGAAVVAGPGPAIGGEVDETPVVTHHSITVDGKTINYTATVAQMP